MSHFQVLSRLIGGDRSGDMIKRLVRKEIDKFERDWKYDASYIRAAALVVGIGLAAPVAAHASVQPAAVTAYTLTPRRIGASLAVAVALIGAVIGGRALARAADRIGAANGRRGAIVALVLGPVGLVSGGLVVATANGGLGTGNGLGGGVVAMMVGLIGMTLGGLALARSRRTG